MAAVTDQQMCPKQDLHVVVVWIALSSATWVGEPWHPTQLGITPDETKQSKGWSLYLRNGKHGYKGSKTQSGPREQLSLEVQWAKAHCHNVSVTSVWQNATSTKEGVQQMWTMGCNKCRQVQQMCAMDVNGVQQMRQQPWQVHRCGWQQMPENRGCARLCLGAWHVIDSVMKWQCRSARWGS